MKESYKTNFIQAGKIAREVRAFGKSLIVKGASYNEVIRKIYAKIAECGAIPAFPPQIALNEVAAHFLPSPDQDILFSDQLVKLDVGICLDGAIGDCAVSIDLSGKHQHLIDAAELALLAAEKIVRVGLPIRELGAAIEEAITSRGLQPVRNLCGHGLGFFRVHTPPLIPNYADKSKGILQPGMTFAIEPFATNGQGLIHEKGASTLFSLIKKKPGKSPLEETLLTKIDTFHNLPFSLHDLLSCNLPLREVEKGVDSLIAAGLIASYPPLVEIAGGFVAQAENSVLIDPQGNVLITTR